MMRVKVLLLLALSILAGNSYAQKREIKLEGTYNFRDIGGYTTKSGKEIKWGKIYRSAKLGDLSTKDLQQLKALKICRIADLRSPGEMYYFPDRIPEGAEYFAVQKGKFDGSVPKDKVEDNWAQMAKDMKTYSEAETDASVIRYYRGLVDTFKDRYTCVFDSLLSISPDSALVFHCTGGKDRSGVVAAMIEYVLGVSRDQIDSDFVLTNKYRESYNHQIAVMLHQKYDVPMDRADDYGISKVKYLEATFNEMAKRYGSLDNYVRTQLGLSPDKIAALQKKFLQ